MHAIAIVPRRPIDRSRGDGVEEEIRSGEPPRLRASAEGMDLAGWADRNRGRIDALLRDRGALLLRGFSVGETADFERAAEVLCPGLYAEYGDLPREPVGGKVYGATPYPPDRPIRFHNEGSHTARWPARIAFCCRVPPAYGGATTTADGRRTHAALSPRARSLFAERGLTYTRNFIPGLDVTWQAFFGTDDADAVETRCRAEGIDLAWSAEGGLRIRQKRPAILDDGGTPVFFNQILLHHPAALPPDVREDLSALFSREEDFPRHVAFGDGSPIPDGLVGEVGEVLDSVAVEFAWERNDVLLVDNVLAAHGRRPFGGDRKIVVAMGSMRES